MVRGIIIMAMLMSALVTKAQSPLSADKYPADTNHLHNKWFFTKYTGISTGFVAFKGGSGSYISAPLAWQANRQLSSNFYAFGAVSATPYLFQMNGQPAITTKSNSYMQLQTKNYGISPAASIGVMYISNDKTFSISGSINVSRNTYNGFSPIYSPLNTFMQ